MSKISIIVPVYYNEENLKDLYEDLKEKVLPYLGEYELIMVDDGSADESFSTIKELRKKDKNIKALKLSRNFGSHAAMLAGLNYCTGDCAVIKAADLQEPSEMILEMYSRWKEGHDVVLAVRQDREEPKRQKIFASIYYKLMRKMAKMDMPKGGFDCFLADKKVINVLCEMDEKNTSLMMQVLWCGFKRTHIYYIRKKRMKGISKWTFSKKIKLVIDSLLGFSFVPIRTITILGVVFSLFSLAMLIFTVVSKIIGNVPVDGYTTMMIIILLSNGIIISSLGLIGEYLWRTFDASRKRPVYIVDELVDEDYNDSIENKE